MQVDGGRTRPFPFLPNTLVTTTSCDSACGGLGPISDEPLTEKSMISVSTTSIVSKRARSPLQQRQRRRSERAPPVHFTIQGSQSPDSFTATGLPTGLSVDARTGKIVGTTTALGDYNVPSGPGISSVQPAQTLVLRVKPIPPTFSPLASDLTASNAWVPPPRSISRSTTRGVTTRTSPSTTMMRILPNHPTWVGSNTTSPVIPIAESRVLSLIPARSTLRVRQDRQRCSLQRRSGYLRHGMGFHQWNAEYFIIRMVPRRRADRSGPEQRFPLQWRSAKDQSHRTYKRSILSIHPLFAVLGQYGRSSGHHLRKTDADGSIIAYQDFDTVPDGLIVECYYKATGTEAEFTVNPEPGSTWHIYGFSNRVAGPARDAVALNGPIPSPPHPFELGPTTLLTGLTLDSTYHFRVAATNSAGTTWTNHAGSFKTNASLLSPVVSVYDANTPTFTQSGATLIGRLNSFDGNDAPTVTVYYGLVDQNLSDTGWDGSAAVGQVQAGTDFSKAVSGLQSGKKYYYRAKAANNAGSSISATSGIFVTLGSPEIETAVASDVTPSSATINAKVIGTGGTTIVYRKITPTTFPDKELGIHFDASAIQGLSNLANVTEWKDISGKARHMNNIRSIRLDSGRAELEQQTGGRF